MTVLPFFLPRGVSMESIQFGPMSPNSLRRINRLKSLGNAKRYLEIGVYRGRTFNQLSFDCKTAVDPRFRFKPNEHFGNGIEFYEMTSDAYFMQASSDRVFDLVFLDGLHTYDQTYRDFCNVLIHSHQDTIVLIDDTLPSDRFSAIRNQQQAYKMRSQESSSQSKHWHGDVYKMIILLRLFHPLFQYATLTGSGNPQTVVWRKDGKIGAMTQGKVPPFPLFEDQRYLYQVFTAMPQADYNWLQENMDVLQCCSEPDLFSFIID